MDTGATFSDCGKYRYDLWRRWDTRDPVLTFIMLNPSTADHTDNDATIERCQRRAIKMGFGGLRVVNLMAYRATDPTELKPLSRSERCGPENEKYLIQALQRSDAVVCGWGKDGDIGPVNWLKEQARRLNVILWCLRTNKDGSPQHPLYIPYSQTVQWWGGKAVPSVRVSVLVCKS